MSVCMTPAGVKYVAQEFQSMTPAGVKFFNYDSCRSQVCLTLAGVKYYNV